MGFFNTILALLIKNVQLKRKLWISTLLELLLPVAFVCLFTYLKSLIDPDDNAEGWLATFEEDGSGTLQTPYTRFVDPRLITEQDESWYEVDQRGDSLFSPMQDNHGSICQLFTDWGYLWNDHNQDGEDCRKILLGRRYFAVAPENEADLGKVQNFVDFVTTNWCSAFDNYTLVYNTSRQFDDYLGSGEYGRDDNPLIASALIFHSIGDPGENSASWDYSIRFNVSGDFGEDCSVAIGVDTKGKQKDSLQTEMLVQHDLTYRWTGFTTIQNAVARYAINLPAENLTRFNNRGNSYINGFSGCTTTVGDTWLNCELFYLPQTAHSLSMPVRSVTTNAFYVSVLSFLPLMYLLAFLYPLFRIIVGMVEEKELKIKEGLGIMGVSDFQLTFSWYITYTIIYIFISIPVTIFCKEGFFTSKFTGIFENSDGAIIFFLFFFFGLSVLSFSYLVSAFFSKAKVAGVVGVMAFFASSFGVFGTESASESTKNGLCFLSPLAFSLGIQSMGTYETAGLGVTNDNSNELQDNFRFRTALTLLIVDCLIYTFLGWYFGKVIPRQWGVVEPWYFLFTPEYWVRLFGLNKKQSSVRLGAEAVFPEAYEEVAPELKELEKNNRSVELVGLTKTFDTSTGVKVAVDKLSLSMYEGQIFALLGHNGAGKTTTINMLSGMLGVDGGFASILGYDLGKDMNQIRNTMGVCPQHDVLYPNLTVHQHLMMFGRIKGMSGQALRDEVTQKIEEVDLIKKTHALSSTLSGGQKRKLSVAIALIGDSKVVFLDEPTSGMDPHSRRFTWEILRNNRKGRIMVLTTHFMDEADKLGDRIAIMANGKLQCCGTSMYLKNRYGEGYHLTISKTADCNEGALTKLIEEKISGAKLLNNVGTELTYQLPNSEISNFPSLLKRFDKEEKKEKYGVQEYGISVTTMEEIFIRVAREGDKVAQANEVAELRRSISERRSETDLSKTNQHIPIGHASFLSQTSALYKKRALVGSRDKKSVLCTLFIPFVLVLAGLCIIKYTGDTGDSPSLVLSTSPYRSNFPLPYHGANGQDIAQVLNEVNGADMSRLSVDLSRGTGRLWGFDYINGFPCPEESTNIDCNDPRWAEALGERLSAGVVSNNATTDVLAFSDAISAGWRASDYYDVGVLGFEVNTDDNIFRYATLTNTTVKHGTPISLGMVNDAAAKLLRDSTLTVRNWPFPVAATTASINSAISAFNATIFIMIAIAFIPASFVTIIVRERENVHNAKHLHMLSGCRISSYWLGNYLWDLTNYLPFMVLAVILVAAFDIEPMVDHDAIWAVLMLFFGFGLAAPPFTYVLSFFFSQSSTAQNLLLLFNFLTGLVLTIVSFIMSLEGLVSKNTRDINESMKYMYRLFPAFCVGDGLYGLAIENINSGVLGGAVEVWKWKVSSASIVFLLIDAVVYSILVVIIDTIYSYPNLRAIFTQDPKVRSPDLEIDEDVEAEEARAEGTPNDAVSVLKLRKTFQGKAGKMLAVDDLQFGIPKGECFGLLGINGAGKTTTLKMLTGDVVPSSGHARLNGLDVLTQLQEVRKVVGYCPQFDALTENLTVREHLELYCTLKGIPKDDMGQIVERKLIQLDLKEFENRQAQALSGGNKRKLSVAIAIIGNPPIIFLDEPSTGMDPVARRFMWKVIADVSTQSKESTVILTTHSMEECEALCTKVAIMVAGRFRCHGNVQRLKTRFGQGFTVEAKLKQHEEEPGEEGGPSQTMTEEASFDAVKSFFSKTFPGSHVVEESPGNITFRLPQEEMSVSQVFQEIEDNKEHLSISEYSCSQTTLEQIFNFFASQQEDSVAPGLSMKVPHRPSTPLLNEQQQQAPETPVDPHTEDAQL